MNPLRIIAEHEARTMVTRSGFVLSFLITTLFVGGFAYFMSGVGSLFSSAGAGSSAFGPGFVLGMAFFMVTMGSSMHLLTALLEEKTSKVIEVLLSAVSTEQLLLGKVVGVSLVALAQVVVWLVVGSFAVAMGSGPMGVEALSMPWLRIVGMLLFAGAGFFMFAVLLVAGGSLASDMRGAQSVSMLVMVSVMLPLQAGFFLSQTESSGLQILASLFPLTAPTVMIMRLGTGGVPLWQLAVSFALLLATAKLSLRLGGTAFDLGLLSTGRVITWKMVVQTYMARRRH